MGKHRIILLIVIVLLSGANVVLADTFGTVGNQFTIDFVNISGDASSANGTNISQYSPNDDGYKTFTDPGDFRMGIYEITNDQWNDFKSDLGVPVTGSPSDAYDAGPYWANTNVPANEVSWYEAAQFVNWLNTSKGYQAAYKFTGTQGQSDYALDIWSAAEAAGGTNLYRHKDAIYFLPTEDEWVKAAYWNGTALQDYATKSGESLAQGDGTSGTGWNYYKDNYATDPFGPWDVGSGSEELNGTFDMMGNVWEWMENHYIDQGFEPTSYRGIRGGSYINYEGFLRSSHRDSYGPIAEYHHIGFRVASIPEPATILLIGIGGLTLIKRRHKR